MAYVGQTPLTGAYQLCDAITTSATATYNLTINGVAVTPVLAQNCIVSLNGVIQAPVSGFTISGSTITFSDALTSADVINFILILGSVGSIGTPTNGTVTTSSLASGFTLPTTSGGTGLTTIGTAGQALKVNSGATGLEYGSAGFNGATTTSSAVDITLTSASTQVQNVTMTASSKSVILPNATTLTTKGAPIFVINNQGVLSISIKNNSGYILTNVDAGSSTLLTLNDNATANGSWSTYNTYFNIAGSDFATLISGTTGVVDIGACAQGNFFYGITSSKISSTSAIITYQKGTSNRDVYGVVVSYSGTTITVNSETLLYNGSSTAATNANVLMLDSTSGFLFVSRASNSVVVPFTISGSTITAGTSSSTFGVGTYNDSTTTPLGSAIAMSSTIALLTESNSTTTNTFIFRTVTHNGSSAPTIGTASAAVTTFANYYSPMMSKIDSTNAFVAYQAASTAYMVSRVVTISGSSAPTLQTANTSHAVNSDAQSSIVSISSTKFSVVNYTRSLLYTVSGTTVSYSGSQNYNTAVGGASIIAVLGDFVIMLGYNGTAVSVIKILNDYFYNLPGYTSTKSYYMRAYGNFSSSYLVALDSTTAFGITNAAGSSTISIQLLKIL